MYRLTRYILGEIMVPAALALLVFSFIGVANELRERMDDIQVPQVEVGDFARLTVLFLPTLLYYIFPLMYMMGIMLAFGRLAQNNEITAMKAAGIPLKRIVAPVLFMGALLSVACFLLQDQIQPYAMRKAHELIYRELPQRMTLDALTPGVMHEIGGWRVYIGRKDGDTLRDLDILAPQETGEMWLYHADKARFVREDGRSKLLFDEVYIIMPQEGGRSMRVRLTDHVLEAPPPKTKELPSELRMMSLAQLLKQDKLLSDEVRATATIPEIRSMYLREQRLPAGVSIRTLGMLGKVRDEIRQRLSLPLACLAVSLAAAPLAVRGGRGGRSFSFAIGFAICLIYYTLLMTVKTPMLVRLSEAILLGAIPNLVVGLAGCWFLWRVDRV